MTRALFLDRDGTLNVEKSYLWRIADWEWIPGTQAALLAAKAAGWKLIVVTNQSGIARGMYGEAELAALHAHANAELGGAIDGFYHCPHHPDFSADCDCRKPKPGMLLRAAAEHGIDLSQSVMIGDKLLDLHAGDAARVRQSILVRTGYGREFEASIAPHHLVVDDLAAACETLEITW